MDMFMDKLAQKLTAQEIIKANAAADAEELGKLKNQIAEYNQCLEKLQALIEEGTVKLEGARIDGGQINCLVEESIGKIRSMQQDHTALDQLKAAYKRLAEQMTGVEKSLQEGMDKLLQLEEGSGDQLDARLSAVEESIHKECVKVYRNVQAVVVEESGKQKEELAEVKTASGKLGVVLGVSIAAFIFSLVSAILQVLSFLNISF